MDPAKLTTSLTELVKKFVISFCEVNVGYHDRLDVFGSIHVRSDDCDVVAFVLNEHCYKNSCEVSEEDEAGAEAQNATPDGPSFGARIKSEAEDAEGISVRVKLEGEPLVGNDVIDVYSDVEEMPENVIEDVDQSFIDQLLDDHSSQNTNPNRQNITTNIRQRRGQNHQRFQQKRQQHDSSFLQESEDFTPDTDFQYPAGSSGGEVDYGPAGEGATDSKFGGTFGDVSGSSRKRRKRNVPSQALMNSAQGSYFQFESTYTCTACGCRFKSMDGLKCHVNSKHLLQKLYSCHFCSQTFLTRQASYSHRVKFHNISRSKAPLPVGGKFA